MPERWRQAGASRRSRRRAESRSSASCRSRRAHLVAKGYDVNYAWGIGVHSHDMGGAMLPEMMRWLWRDHPVSVDPNDTVERGFRAGKAAPPAPAPPPG